MDKKSIDAVLSRLMTIFVVNTDSDLAKKLGVNRQTLASWRKRDSIPYSLCINLAEQQDISLDWLLGGKGKMSAGEGKDSHSLIEGCNDDDCPLARKWLEMFAALDEDGQKNILQDIAKEQQQTELRQQLKELKETIERLNRAG
ncbi:TPA: bacteriophage CI repressor [Salmonella enterica subsp. diarizonae]|nr:bacteriophage CI repressor [Salmonella enterica subsp. diarizonae]